MAKLMKFEDFKNRIIEKYLMVSFGFYTQEHRGVICQNIMVHGKLCISAFLSGRRMIN